MPNIKTQDIPDPDGFHQHIDLIYFCRPLSGSVRLAIRALTT